jgi:pimeloyl-ACP methyl ester carboxylesterase
MESADMGGVRLAYDVRGSGQAGTVVLAGGSGMPPLVWDLCGLTDALDAAGYQVVTYSARGVAPSDAPPPPYTIAELANDLAGLLGYLGVSDCRLVGYSLGGFVAEMLARHRPELLRCAVLLGSAGQPGPVALARCHAEAQMVAALGYLPAPFMRFNELMTSLPPSVLRDDAEQVGAWWELLGAHEDSWTSTDGAVGHSMAAVQWLQDEDHLTQWPEISVPVLVACFEHDLFFPPAAGIAAAAAIPRGEFIEIPDAAHAGLLTHPLPCIDAIIRFLEAA